MVKALFDTNILVDYLNAVSKRALNLTLREKSRQYHHMDGGDGWRY